MAALFSIRYLLLLVLFTHCATSQTHLEEDKDLLSNELIKKYSLLPFDQVLAIAKQKLPHRPDDRYDWDLFYDKKFRRYVYLFYFYKEGERLRKRHYLILDATSGQVLKKRKIDEKETIEDGVGTYLDK
ncbi:MAG TPA: PepSY domain-containing protein [Flavobacterium sp.]|nr:PepSY domain-containing protein [Flavobacterium sp.]